MFLSLFSTVSVLLIYMAVGFVLVKTGKASLTHIKTITGLLIYVLGPSMVVNSFLQLEFSWEAFAKIGIFFGLSLAAQIVFFLLIFIVIRRKYADSRYRILTIGSVLGNVGFLGMHLVSSVFPSEPIVLCYSSIYVMTMNLIVFTIGVYLLTNEKKYVSLKSAILNPTSIALIISIPLFMLNVHFPSFILQPVELLAKMSTPVCMIILGMRLAQSSLKALFTRGFVYFTCLLKLVAFPVLSYFFVKLIPLNDPVLKTSLVLLAMTPSGAIIESLAELHDCQQEFAANVVLMTTILCVLTIPVMSLLLVK